MKSRPRRIENQVADLLNVAFADVGLEPVERIPVTGRTGPDISINSAGLVVDVKSRKEVPVRAFNLPEAIISFGPLVGLPLRMLSAINDLPLSEDRGCPKVLLSWWAHLEFWTRRRYQSGTTCLAVHRTGKHIRHGTLIVHRLDLTQVKGTFRVNT